MRKCLTTVVLAAILAGCTVVHAGSGGSSRTFVGLVRVDFPETVGKVSAVSVKSLGAGWEKGPFLGWRDASWVTVSPQDCELVVIVRSGVQAEHAAAVLKTLQGEKLCAANFSQ